jgi:hypothetical protein
MFYSQGFFQLFFVFGNAFFVSNNMYFETYALTRPSGHPLPFDAWMGERVFVVEIFSFY